METFDNIAYPRTSSELRLLHKMFRMHEMCKIPPLSYYAQRIRKCDACRVTRKVTGYYEYALNISLRRVPYSTAGSAPSHYAFFVDLAGQSHIRSSNVGSILICAKAWAHALLIANACHGADPVATTSP